MIYYILWGVSFIGLILGVFWLNLLFFKENKRVKLKGFAKVSIIIPAHNEEGTIERTIDSLLKLNYPKNRMEIIVVNDESTDNTAGVAERFKHVKLINNRHRGVGKASAVNCGLKYAIGEFVAIVDADSEVSRNSLRNALKHFSSGKVGSVITPIKVLKSKNIYNHLQRIEYSFTAMIRELMSRINTLYYSHRFIITRTYTYNISLLCTYSERFYKTVTSNKYGVTSCPSVSTSRYIKSA